MKNKDYPFYDVPQVSNLKELIGVVADKYGDKPAFTFERNNEIIHISYRQFQSDVDALGTALFNLDIRNTKIAVLGENSYEWILTYFATVKMVTARFASRAILSCSVITKANGQRRKPLTESGLRREILAIWTRMAFCSCPGARKI